MFKRTLLVFVLLVAGLSAGIFAQDDATSGYVSVNGLEMYYEIHGEGEPLIMLHGGYMAIPTMGEIVPRLAQSRQVIAFELQGHGRTADIDRPLSYEQMADDVTAAMRELGIEQADIFGYSMGAGVALQMAIRNPEVVDQLVLISPAYSSDAYYPGFFEMIDMMTPDMFAGTPIVTDYEALAPDPAHFPVLMEKLVALDSQPYDIPAEVISAIQAPTLIIAGDSDSVRPEHVMEFFRLLGGGVDGELMGLPQSRLAILPASSHIGLLFRVDLLEAIITEFLDTPVS